MTRRSLSLSVVIFCALVSSMIAGASAARPTSRADRALEDYKGKVVLLDFWASWCAPCKESFPWMEKLQQRFGDRGFVVVAVNLDRDRALAQRFLQAQRADFPVIFDPTGQWAEHFDVKSMPSSFYIDRSGTVRFTHAGFHLADVDANERELAALIAER